MGTSVARATSPVTLANGNFLPEVWSKKLQAKFYSNTVLSDIVNRDYEGEIKTQGSKVIIRKRPTISIGNYEVNGEITYQNLTDDKVELLIDKAKYFAFKVDDVDKAQADIQIINECTMDASQQMAIAIDTDVLGTVYGDATTALTSVALDKTTVIDWIVDANVALDELYVPREGRFIVIPAWVGGLIKKSDLKDASISGDSVSVMRNGKLGLVDNTMIYISNNLAHATVSTTETWHPICGTKHAISFASQVTKVETIRPEKQFGDAIRGLNVYGFEVTAPDALVHMPITRTV